MKRTDITTIFPDATGEQIDKLMDLNGNDINNAKKGVEAIQSQLEEAQRQLAEASGVTESLKTEQERANSLQAQLDQMTAAETLRVMREKVSTETGIPVRLLTGETEDACREQATAISDFAKPKYPAVRDAGEQHVDVKQATRDQFKDWFDSNINH